MSRPTVLLFLAQGCPACHEYLPRFERASRAYRARGVADKWADEKLAGRGLYVPRNEIAVGATRVVSISPETGGLRVRSHLLPVGGGR